MQLERRYWKIDDLSGNIDEVDGPGVIGQYPKLFPGTYHSYASRTSFQAMVNHLWVLKPTRPW